MNLALHASILALFPLLSSAASAVQEDSPELGRALEAIQPERLEADLYYLACDEMRGRDTPSNEQRLAARFIVNRLKRLGFQPGGRYGYLPEYPLTYSRVDAAGCKVTLNGDTELALGRHYVLAQMSDAMDLDLEAGLVFAGEGDSSDLRKSKLEGSWAVVQHDGGSLRKLSRDLAEAGAVGAVLIPAADDDVVGRHERSMERMLAGRFQRSSGGGFPMITLTQLGAERFRSTMGIADELPDAGKTMRGELREVRRLVDPRGYRLFENVAGFWPGADPELSKEVLIVSAHYDHVGVQGGRIHNGADDNGSGTTGLLGIAEALSAYGPMQRSVLLLWVSGEEKGLLGSAGWTRRPWLPEGCRPVADLNIDMIGRNAPNELLITPTKDGDVSHEYNALVRMVEAAGPKEGFDNFKSADAYWRRSDHMNFADNLKLPVAFLFTDVHEDYHKPTDDPWRIDYDKMSRVARLVVRMLDGLQAPNLQLSPRPIPSLADFEQQMRLGMAMDDLERLRLGSDHFQRAEGKAPRNLDELLRSETWRESGLDRPGIGKDPWGREYRLRGEGERAVVSTLGADGREGGEGEDADLSVE